MAIETRNNEYYEKLRLSYKPDVVKVLLVGESRPSWGNFFYDTERPDWLRECTRQVFSAIYKEARHLGGDDFLKFFKEKGFYLEDLCHEPVDFLSPEDRAIFCQAGVNGLSDNIAQWKPSTVITILLRIEDFVSQSIGKSGTSPHCLIVPYPKKDTDNVEIYITKLARFLKQFREQEGNEP